MLAQQGVSFLLIWFTSCRNCKTRLPGKAILPTICVFCRIFRVCLMSCLSVVLSVPFPSLSVVLSVPFPSLSVVLSVPFPSLSVVLSVPFPSVFILIPGALSVACVYVALSKTYWFCFGPEEDTLLKKHLVLKLLRT